MGRLKQGLGGKRGAGVPGYGVPGCEKHGVWWKTRGLVENTGSGGKHGVWKTRGLVESTGSGGNTGSQWKTRGLSAKHSGTIISSNKKSKFCYFKLQ